jgi:deoxyribonuclease V
MAPPALLSLSDLPAALRTLIAQIPPYRVTTFGDLATALGDAAAARWVAQWLRREWESAPSDCAPTRVVLRTGELPSWSDSLRDWQSARLVADGVPMLDPFRVDPCARWADFITARPLQQLRDWQIALARHAQWTPWDAVPDVVAAVDLSYATPEIAVAAYVAIDVTTGDTLFEHTVTSPVPFPYITGYLTFRELPPLLTLLGDVRRQTALAPVILVDGSGRLHPRQSGLAVGVGVCGGCRTIAVAKHQLCGQIRREELVNGCPTIWLESDCLGAVMATGSKRRTAFISPGHEIDLASAIGLVRSVWRFERSPLPIARADALSRRVAKTVS